MLHARSSETESDHLPAAAPGAADAVLRQIGRWLQEARERQGLDLHDVADELRIRPAYLQGLEEGSLAAMPGRPYALGFLRSYASCLGLDGDDLVRRVKAADGGAGERPDLSVPTPVAESRLPKVQLLVVSLVLVGALYGGWRYVNGDAQPPAETVAEVPEALREAPVGGLPPAHPAAPSDPVRAFASERPAFLPPVEPDAADASGATAPSGPVAETAAAPEAPAAEVEELAAAVPARPDPDEAAAAERWPEGDATAGSSLGRTIAAVLMEDIDLPADEPAVAGPAGEAGEDAGADPGPSVGQLLAGLDPGATDRLREGRTYGRANRGARVRLEAVEPSWIQVRSSDNTYTYTRTLQPGDVYLVPDRTDLALWTGNAGGLRVVVDGRNLPPLGGSREVKRDLPLDPERLLARR